MDFFTEDINSKKVNFVNSTGKTLTKEFPYFLFSSKPLETDDTYDIGMGNPTLLCFVKLLIEIEYGENLPINVDADAAQNRAAWAQLVEISDKLEEQRSDSYILAIRGGLFVYKAIAKALKSCGLDDAKADAKIRKALYKKVVSNLETALEEATPKPSKKRRRTEIAQPDRRDEEDSDTFSMQGQKRKIVIGRKRLRTPDGSIDMLSRTNSVYQAASIYTIGWICPLEVEQIVACSMLDRRHERLSSQPWRDQNVYTLGEIHGHNVVIMGLSQTGNCPAAAAVTQMINTFPNIEFGLLVGIGGGVPIAVDTGMVRLGHVVVGKPSWQNSGTVQYDHGKSFHDEFKRTGTLPAPPKVLLNAAQDFAAWRPEPENDPVMKDIKRVKSSHFLLRDLKYPGAENDHLYPATYKHQTPGESCKKAGCDPALRSERPVDDKSYIVEVHRGAIGSGESVVKDSTMRDRFAQVDGLLSFEMEAAGAGVDLPCMVIRGISDYCDSHKNDEWHGFAAAAAASYARQLISHLPNREQRT